MRETKKEIFAVTLFAIFTVLVTLVLPCMAFAQLPDTGQTKCYDDTGEITCPQPGEPFYGQDAQYPCNQQSYTQLDEYDVPMPFSADYSTTPWAMILDNVTGLMWEVKTDDGGFRDKDLTYNWADAIAYCENLILNNDGEWTSGTPNASGVKYDDWRLPAIKELSFIRNMDTYNPAINTDYFPNTELSSGYWSSTSIVYNQSFAWDVYFINDGGVSYGGKSGYDYVRAVRGGQSTQSLIDNEDGTVTDINTGLMWEQKTIDNKGTTYTWEAALSYCEDLSLAEYNDWRLPDSNELQSLVDYSRYQPLIDYSVFPNTVSSFYWSSTSRAYSPSNAWYVYFKFGTMHSLNKSGYGFVRAVRGGQCCGSSGLLVPVLDQKVYDQTIGTCECGTSTCSNCEGYNPHPYRCSIHEIGCTITCLTMVMQYFNLQDLEVNQKDPNTGQCTGALRVGIDPEIVDDWLTCNGAYESDCLMGHNWEILPGVIASSKHENSYFYSNPPGISPETYEFIDTALANQRPVIAWIKDPGNTGFTHFVVIRGRTGDSYCINDPWNGVVTTLENGELGNYLNDKAIYSCRKFYTVDLSITSVKPIQVIEGIPLVKDKATMVRVEVKAEGLEDGEKLEDVTCRLDFGTDPPIYLTKTLINHDGTTYVLPAPGTPGVTVQDFESKRDDPTISAEQFKNKWLKKWKYGYGIDAYNFEDSSNPLLPQTEGTISIITEIDSNNTITESYENNNIATPDEDINVRPFKYESYRVLFQRLSKNGSPSDFNILSDDLDFYDFAKAQYNYLKATYPIPETENKPLMWFHVKSDSLAWGTSIFLLNNRGGMDGYDRVVYIVPLNTLGAYGLTHFGAKTIFIEEDADYLTLAHEMGHTYWLREEYETEGILYEIDQNCDEYLAFALCAVPDLSLSECGGDWDEITYPWGYIAGNGWDVSEVTSLNPKISLDPNDYGDATTYYIPPYNYFTFMNNIKTKNWAPSVNNPCNSYNILFDALVSDEVTVASSLFGSNPKVILVKGSITEEGCDLEPFYTFEGVVEEFPPGNYSIECVSVIDDILYEVSFEPFHMIDLLTDEEVAQFAFNIPYPEGTAKIVLKHNSTVLQEVIVTPNSPIVEITSLTDLGNEDYEVIWNASDLDGDDLTYSILYTHNDDVWLPMEHGTTTTPYDYTFNTSTLPGGNISKIKIVTTDGVNTVETVSDPFSVPIKTPSASIRVPSDGSVFVYEREVTFRGYGYDPEDGLLDDPSLVWTSDIDGEIGTGSLMDTFTLFLGEHTITLTATDSQDQYATDEITITIEEELDGDGVPDGEDNCPNDYNPFQIDNDLDDLGDACDPDDDNDTILDVNDNCPFIANQNQENNDNDEFGNACDNCPCHDNPNQVDLNENGVGDVCEDRKGDVNDNGTIEVGDIQSVINIILEVPPQPILCELWAGDCDNNDTINVSDVQIAINKLLTQ